MVPVLWPLRFENKGVRTVVTKAKQSLEGILADRATLMKALVCVVVGLAIFLIPAPHGVDPRGMHLLGVFVGTILALILQPLPTPAVAFVGLALAMLTGAMDVSKEAFEGLGSSSIWLIVSAVFFAEGFMVTGLGRRIALLFISLLGKSSLGISYGLAAADLVIAPATPSNTARLGGILFPIIRSISDVQGSNTKSDESRKKLGAYLSATASNINVITSVMFITACAAGPVMAGMAEQGGTHIAWGTWAIACVVPGLVCMAIIPALIYKIFPPTIKHVPTAKTDAKRELHEMGPLNTQEWIMTCTFVLMIILWATGSITGIAAVTVAFLGVSILLCCGILSWKTMAADKSAWQTLMFFGILVGMAKPLSALGVIPWIGDRIAGLVGGMPWYATLVVLSIAYVLIHYLFASELA